MMGFGHRDEAQFRRRDADGLLPGRRATRRQVGVAARQVGDHLSSRSSRRVSRSDRRRAGAVTRQVARVVSLDHDGEALRPDSAAPTRCWRAVPRSSPGIPARVVLLARTKPRSGRSSAPDGPAARASRLRARAGRAVRRRVLAGPAAVGRAHPERPCGGRSVAGAAGRPDSPAARDRGGGPAWRPRCRSAARAATGGGAGRAPAAARHRPVLQLADRDPRLRSRRCACRSTRVTPGRRPSRRTGRPRAERRRVRADQSKAGEPFRTWVTVMMRALETGTGSSTLRPGRCPRGIRSGGLPATQRGAGRPGADPLASSGCRRLATTDLTGVAVREVVSRGKHQLFRFANDFTLHTHFRMEGAWRIYPRGRKWTGGPDFQIRAVLATAEHDAVGYRLPVTELLPTADEYERGRAPRPRSARPGLGSRRGPAPDQPAARPHRSARRCSTSATWRASARSTAPSCCSCKASTRVRRSPPVPNLRAGGAARPTAAVREPLAARAVDDRGPAAQGARATSSSGPVSPAAAAERRSGPRSSVRWARNGAATGARAASRCRRGGAAHYTARVK